MRSIIKLIHMKMKYFSFSNSIFSKYRECIFYNKKSKKSILKLQILFDGLNGLSKSSNEEYNLFLFYFFPFKPSI